MGSHLLFLHFEILEFPSEEQLDEGGVDPEWQEGKKALWEGRGPCLVYLPRVHQRRQLQRTWPQRQSYNVVPTSVFCTFDITGDTF
jgi:hypothetical protein